MNLIMASLYTFYFDTDEFFMFSTVNSRCAVMCHCVLLDISCKVKNSNFHSCTISTIWPFI